MMLNLKQVWWLVMTYVWGMVKLWILSDWGFSLGEDQEWTFGQVLPLLLLAVPLITLLEVFYSGKKHIYNPECIPSCALFP